MLRLSAPTRRTFAIGGVAILAGILGWFDFLDLGISSELAFYLTAAGAVVLMIGNIFNRL